MATTEKTRVIRIDTSESIKSISDLKAQVSEYRKELNECTIGSEEARVVNIQLREAQAQLTAAMNGAVKATGELDNSYNGLVSQMAALKASWRATTDETERAALGEKIANINSQLKDMDASVGNFQRNVGNYTQSMTDAFNSVGINIGNINPLFKNLSDSLAEGSAKGESAMTVLSGSVKGLAQSFKALIANPVGAVIMAIVMAVKAAKAVFDGFKKSVDGNEVASNNMAKALAPLKGIADGVKSVFDDFVETLTKVASGIGGVISAVMDFLGIASEQVELENQIAEMQADNAEKHRKNIVENSKLELEASEARAKVAEKDKYSAEERLKFAKEYAEKQKEIAANNLEEAQNELKLIEAQAATGKNNKEMNDKIAEAQAKVNNVQKAYNEILRSSNEELSTISSEIENEKKAEEKAKNDSWKKKKKDIEDAKNTLSALIDEVARFGKTELENGIGDIQKNWQKKIEEYETAYNKLSKKERALRKEEYEQYISDAKAQMENEINQLYVTFGDKVVKANEEFYKATRSVNEQEVKDVEDKYDSLIKAQEEYLKLGYITQKDFEERKAELIIKKNEETAKVQANQLKIAAETELETVVNGLETVSSNITEMLYKGLNEGTISEEKALDLLKKMGLDPEKAKDLIQQIKDEISNADLGEDLQVAAGLMGQMSEITSALTAIGEGISAEWAKVFSGLEAGIAELGDNLAKGEKGWKTWGKMASQACAVASSAFGALADEQDETTEEGFKNAKALRYAEALFSMASGMVSVWPAAMELGPIAGPIVGSVLSAMIATIGGIQMSKISKTKFGDTSSGNETGANVNYSGVASAAVPSTYTQDVQGASIEETIGTQEVWVSVSEINKKQNSVGVAVSESKF